jgi:adenylate cyclase
MEAPLSQVELTAQNIPSIRPQRAPKLVLPPVTDWLMREGRLIENGPELFVEMSERLAASGIPLTRATLHARVLHPQLLGFNYLWRKGEPLEIFQREHGIELTDSFLLSPIRVIMEGAAGLRRRLDLPNPHLDFPILEELKAEGYTDYVAMGLDESVGHRTVLSWATDRPGGFSTEDLATLYDLLPFLSLIVEVKKLARTAANLLDVYLGPLSGQRVLHGSIKRGELETIHAALWYCDMRGFTPLSDNLPAAEVILLLNEFFEAMAQPVIARGGEVLKFIGDAMLAIFPLDPIIGNNGICAAIEAASEALHNLRQLNERLAAEGRRTLRCGIALHIGDVGYGNIGAPSRLDFTVIGPAVNKVARIEAQTKRVDHPLLVSADFARLCTYPLVSLGWHALRGIAEPEELFYSPEAEAGPEELAASER